MFSNYLQECQYNKFFKIVSIQEDIKEKWRLANEYINNIDIVPVKIIKHDKQDLFTRFNENVYIAGGAANFYFTKEKNGKLKDLDLFIVGDINKFRETFLQLKKILESNKKIIKVYETYYTYTIEYSDEIIQIIKKPYRSVNEILSMFDLPCCRVAMNNKNFYITPDYKFCVLTGTFGLNFKMNSIAYLDRANKYKKFYKIIEADVINENNIITDFINKKYLFIGDTYEKPINNVCYTKISNNHNLYNLLNKNYHYLIVENGKIKAEKLSKKRLKEIKIFIAKIYPQYNSFFIAKEEFIKKFLEHFEEEIKFHTENIQKHINVDNLKTFSFSNRKDLKSPREYYRNKIIEHLNYKNFDLIIFEKKRITQLLWCFPLKLPKYLVSKIINLLF